MRILEAVRPFVRSLSLVAMVVVSLLCASCGSQRYQVHDLVGLSVFEAQQDEDFSCGDRLRLKLLEYDAKHNKIVIVPPTADDAKCKVLYQVPWFGPRMSANGDVGVIIDKPAGAATATVKFKVPPLAFDPPKYTVGDALGMAPFNTNPGLKLQVIFFNGSALIVQDPDNTVYDKPIKGQTPAPGTELDAGGIVGVVIDGPIQLPPPGAKGKGSPPN